jgi:ATP-binding cassette, subfamily B (MDR/TAP), member 1
VSTFITAFIVSFIVQWKLTLVIIAIVPVNLIVTVICLTFTTIIENTVVSINAKADSIADEAFSSIRTIHAFWAYPKLSRKFTAILDQSRIEGNKKSILWAILFSLEFFCIYSGYALAFWQGIRFYASGEITDPGVIVT